MNSAVVRRLSAIALLLVASAALAAEERTPLSPLTAPDFTAVVTSGDVSDPLTNAQLKTCIRETARIMKVDTQGVDRPQIVILQLSPAEAKRLGLTKTVLLTNRGNTHPRMFYEVWIIGQYGLVDMARGVETVLENHYGLTYTDKERAKVVNEVSKILNSTVSVKSLQAESDNR